VSASTLDLTAARQRKPRIAWMYLIHNEVTGLYKIGISYDVDQRRRELECAGGVPLRALLTFPGSRGAVTFAEETAHRRFRRVRRLGEWFALTDRDLTVLPMFVHRAIREHERWERKRARKAERDAAFHQTIVARVVARG
jgi:hypothetical protein